MSHKKISPEEAFENINSSLSKYVDLAEQDDESPAIFEDILLVDDRYIHADLINQGGMKKILKTTDALTKRPVAKASLIDFEDSVKTENFLREARLTAALEHPNIIPVYDIGVDESEGPYFIMKLIGGKSLACLLKDLSNPKKSENYSLQDLMDIFLKICDAVSYAHSKGIIHLDLKPQNIQIDDYGEVLVCDWGLAKVMSETESKTQFNIELDPIFYNDVTLDGYMKGTPGFMAPEQINTNLGPKNEQTDIYALGGILYCMLALQTPFGNADLPTIIQATLNGEIKVPSIKRAQIKELSDKYVPSSLEAVAMKALATKAEERYQSVPELRQEIYKWMGGFATEAENAGFMKSLYLLLKRHRNISIVLFLSLLAAIFAIYKIKDNEAIAVANEKKALANEKRALDNEAKTKEALSLYLNEKELTERVAKHSIKQLEVINDYHLHKLHFDKALDFINRTLEYRPESEVINALKGEIHFYRQEFDQALLALEKAGDYKAKAPLNLMYKLAPEFVELSRKSDFLKADDLARLMLAFDKKYRYRLFNYEASKFELAKGQNPKDYIDKARLDNHLQLCKIFMLHQNDLKTLDFTYELTNKGLVMDFSNNAKLEYLNHIKHLPVYSLNLQNTYFWTKWIFKHNHLKVVDIRNSQIKKMRFNELQDSTLREIRLSQEQFDNSETTSGIKKRINFIVE